LAARSTRLPSPALEVWWQNAYNAAMKHTSIPRALVATLMLLGGSTVVWAEESAQPPPALHGLTLRLTAPDWPPLTAEQISAIISDRTVIVENGYEPFPGTKVQYFYKGGCPPYETFYQDGRWEMGMCQRTYRVYQGRWSTEAFRGGERLCVEASDYPKQCRFVWQGSAASQIVMPLSLGRSDEANDVYSPYRLSPRRQ
jgi:hypothetical protein